MLLIVYWLNRELKKHLSAFSSLMQIKWLMSRKIGFAFFLFFCTNISYGQLKGKVINVHDGDTFTLLTKESQQVKVRLHGIDCPEIGQDYGNIAKQYTRNLIIGKNVLVDITDTDRYGRVVAIVYVDDTVCVNEQLLEKGLAWHYKKYDKNVNWDILESDAKEHKTGLWAQRFYLAPWVYRRKKD